MTAPCRRGAEPRAWLENQGVEWLSAVEVATLDLSGTYRAVFDATVPHAARVADPFHVVKLANEKLDECRRRVQNETLGHRGRKNDPLYRCRRLLTKADERLEEHGRSKLLGLLRAGDPKGEVATAWHAKETVRELYCHDPVEVRSLGRTLRRWRLEIAAWHDWHVSNGPTEAMNNLIKPAGLVAAQQRHSALNRQVAGSKNVETEQAEFTHRQPRVLQLR